MHIKMFYARWVIMYIKDQYGCAIKFYLIAHKIV